MEISNLTKRRIEEYLAIGKRFDERGLLEYKDISIEFNVSKNAEGSARIKMGNTEVIAGVKLDVTVPYPDSEDQGVLITTAELLPLSSPKFETGPPKINAIEVSRVVDRGIRESGFIDFKKLCIKKKELVWNVFLDIFTVNADGNLIDACFLAAVAALSVAKIPKYDEKNERVQYGELTSKGLPLAETPLMLTFYKIGDSIILDPTEEEEEASDARVSIALTKKAKGDTMINAMQKGKNVPFSIDDMLTITAEAEKKFNSISPKIKKQIESGK